MVRTRKQPSPPSPFFDPPPGGLVPVGDTGLYGTPDEPASPTDCERWPDSPWCGGNPFSSAPFAFEPSIVMDECNIGIQVDGVFGFVKVPPVSLVWRRPECRLPPPPQPFEPPEEGDYETPAYVPPNSCQNSRSGLIAVAFPHYRYVYTEDGNDNNEVAISASTTTVKLEKFDFYGFGQRFISRRVFTGHSYVTMDVDLLAHLKFKLHHEFIINRNYNDWVWRGLYPQLGNDKYGQIIDQEINLFLTYVDNSYSPRVSSELADGSFIWINDGRFFAEASNYRNSRKTYYYEDPNFNNYTLRIRETHFTIDVKCGASTPPPPPPPPLPKRQCCMGCCPNTTHNDELLRLLLKKVNKLSEIVGVDEFPAKMPKRLVYPNAKGDVEIKSIIQALGYQVSQVDKAVGYLPQKIKVTDVNAAQPGNQSVEVEIHSFADFARETLQYVIDTEGDEDTLANIAVRILYECGAIHQAVVQGDAMLDCIVEYLDFKEKWKTVKVPFAFDPYAGQKNKKAGQGFARDKDANKKSIPLTEEELEKMLPALLKETEVEIRVLENEQKRSMNDVLQEILRDARIAAAAVSDDAKGSRLEQLVNAAQAILQLQNAVNRNNVRKALTSGDLRTRKKAKP